MNGAPPISGSPRLRPDSPWNSAVRTVARNPSSEKIIRQTETRLRQEFAFGLDEHVQFDLYLDTPRGRNGASSVFEFRGWSAEVR